MTDSVEPAKARTVRTFGSWLASGPLCLALALATWVTGPATGMFPHGPDRAAVARWAFSADSLAAGHWWTPLTAPLLPGHVLDALVATALLVTAGIAAERRLGTLRALGLAVSAQVVGALLAGGTVALVAGTGTEWAQHLLAEYSHGATPVIAALVLAASARLTTLWRRRVRVGVVVLLVVLALFSGHVHDLVRLYAGLVGLAVGVLAWGRRSPQRSLVGTTREGRVLLALTVTAVVFATMLATFSHTAVGPLASVRGLSTGVPYSPEQLIDICHNDQLRAECERATQMLRHSGISPNLLLLMPLVVQLMLAEGLRRGRRAAWVGTVVVQGLSALLALAHLLIVLLASPGLDLAARRALGVTARGLPAGWLLVPVLVPTALVVLTLLARRVFPVRAPRGTYRRLGLVVAGVGVGTAVLVVALGEVIEADFHPSATSGALLADHLLRLVPSAGLAAWIIPLTPVTDAATVLVEVAPLVVWAVLAVLLWRSFHTHDTADAAAGARRARELLHDPGGPSVGWWATWEGNRWWFSPDRAAVVAYRPVAGVALTPCGPICAPADLPDVVVQFAEHAAELGLVPALYSVHADVADAAAALGWTRVQVAEETVLPLPALAFTGKKFQDVRTAMNRATKEGITTEWHTYASLPVGMRDQIHAISEDWVSQKGLPEMGFTLGGVDELADDEVRLLLAVDAERTVHGVTSWLPVFRDGARVGLTLDFMRRRAEGFRPVVELLIAQAALSAKEEGLEFVSLSGAPLARTPGAAPTTAPSDAAGDGAGDGASHGAGDGASHGADAGASSRVLDELLDRLGALLEPVYGFRSLLFFKATFQPIYHPMYLTVPDVADLPVVATALGRAYLPDMTVGQGVHLGTTLLRR